MYITYERRKCTLNMNLFMQAQIEKHVRRYTQQSELLNMTNEKILERKLGEAQKKFFPLTNGKSETQVPVVL